jgi:hypothetical protein
MPSAHSQEALKILRNPATFQWYLIPLLALIVYVYAVEIEKNNMRAIYAGLAYWGMDVFNEIVNGLVFHFSNFAPIWGAPGKSSLLLLMGLNIEITFMFVVSGIGLVKLLPKDKNLKIFGINNRWVIACINSLVFVAVECWLNYIGVLTWEWPWWNTQFPYLIFLFGYLPFNVVCFWIYDMEEPRKQRNFVLYQWSFLVLALIIFIPILNWI